MQNDGLNADHTYDRMREMCNTLIRHAFELGLSESRPVRLPILGWMAVYGGGGETMRRLITVSFVQPQVADEPLLWLNAASRRMFKYIPGQPWRLVFERNQLVDDATALQPQTDISTVAGQPVANVAALKNLNTTILNDTSMVFLVETNSLYKLNKQSSEPQALPDNVVSNFGGCWERQDLSEFRKVFADVKIGEAYGY